jgi:hypothetical protein
VIRPHCVIQPLEERLLFAVNPADMGKGDWIWYLSSARANTGTSTNLALFQYLKNKGMNWVIVKASQGTDPNFNGGQFDLALVRDAHQAGLKLFAYQYPTGANPTGEAEAAKTVLARGADGLIIDAEIEYQNLGKTAAAAAATTYCTTIRAAYPHVFMAHAPFPYVSLHGPFPYYEFGKYCDAVMPQDYWGAFKISPSKMVTDQNNEWNTLYNSWRGTSKADAIKPIVPIAQGWNDASTTTTTGNDIITFTDLLKGLSNPASPGGYKGISYWSVQHHTADMWTGIGNSSIGGTPTNIFAVGETVRVNGTGTSGLRAWSDSSAQSPATFVTKAEDSIATVTGAPVLSPDGYWRYKLRYKGDTVDRWSAEAYLALPPPPAAPTYVSPASGAIVNTPTPTLDWNDAAWAASYDVYVDGALKANVTGSVYTIPAALTVASHTWQVRAVNSQNTVAGATWSLTYAPPPAVPVGPMPLSGTIVQAAPAVLDWADAAFATSYDLYLDGTLAGNVAASNWTLTAAPAPWTTHTWRVVARGNGGTTTGANWTFRVEPVAGDANADGAVNNADKKIVLAHQGSAGDWTAGDFNGDRRVGFADYQILELNFGAVVAAAPPAPAGAAFDEVLSGSIAVEEPKPIFSLTPVRRVTPAPVRRR